MKLSDIRLKMEGKLLSAFFVMILVMAGQGLVSVLNISHISTHYQELWNSYDEAGKTVDNLAELRLKVFQFVGTVKPEEMKVFQENINMLAGQITADLEKYSQFSEMKNLFAKDFGEYQKIMQLHYEYFQTKKAYDVLYGDSQKNFEQLKKQIGSYKESVQNRVKQLAIHSGSEAAGLSGIALAVGLLVSIAGAVFIRRFVISPIRVVITGLEDAYREMEDASDQVAKTGRQIAQETSKQAEFLKETSLFLEEMNSEAGQSTKNANTADHIVKSSAKNIREANSSMNSLNQAMQEISDASRESHKIIGTIDELAFQTNLLALNAAIEAARAGEAGAGFAVVSGEVKNLAMKSAAAAKDIAAIIESTVKKIQEGSALVSKIAGIFGTMEKGSAEVSELITAVAANSDRQAKGVEQISIKMSDMEKTVRQNESDGKELAGTSEKMNIQTVQMSKFIEKLVSLAGRKNRQPFHLLSEFS